MCPALIIFNNEPVIDADVAATYREHLWLYGRASQTTHVGLQQIHFMIQSAFPTIAS